jgi:Cu/Ag efflux protein CusF
MKTWMGVSAALLAAVVMWGGMALAQTKQPDCGQAKTPQTLTGQVTAVDLNQGKVTVRASDGTTHEFQASRETLEGYKVGDRIEAKLRSTPECK